MTIQDFIAANHLILDAQTLRLETDHFIAELQHAMAGQPSSLMALPAYLDPSMRPAKPSNVIFLDAGGTHLRSGLAAWEDGRLTIVDEKKRSLPGIATRMTASEFFIEIAKEIVPYAAKADRIGFCFSFPADVKPTRDAEILRFTKEVNIPDAIGLHVGNELLKAMESLRLPCHHEITILNDTVATLLSGAATCTAGDANYIGLILGTGLNTAITVEKSRLLGFPSLCSQPGRMIINLESGGYKPLCANQIDNDFFASTRKPDEHQFEKLISGGYQGNLFLHYLRTAAHCDCFTAQTKAAILAQDALPSVELDLFAAASPNNTLDQITQDAQEDRPVIQALLLCFAERIAALVRMDLNAVVAVMNTDLPVVTAIEGTVGTKSKIFKDAFTPPTGMHIQYLDGTTLGTALAGLV